ncbi:hypothetical protein E2C01_015987 [Portunus trituberculatus]|uniref:Uncharacterized protein n=1 Tax=Portunus trituberculatus TaxID=210409 RepID=A0A5B7DPV0_PORTR|nr:hypothetical protein [Portunus trituberculatus]
MHRRSSTPTPTMTLCWTRRLVMSKIPGHHRSLHTTTHAHQPASQPTAPCSPIIMSQVRVLCLQHCQHASVPRMMAGVVAILNPTIYSQFYIYTLPEVHITPWQKQEPPSSTFVEEHIMPMAVCFRINHIWCSSKHQPGKPNSPLWCSNHSSNFPVTNLNSGARARLNLPTIAMPGQHTTTLPARG